MFKIIFAVVALFIVFQVITSSEIEDDMAPLLGDVIDKISEQAEQTLPELGNKLSDALSAHDLSSLLESPEFDLSELSELIEKQEVNLEQLQELIESQEFDTEAAQQKLEQLQELVREKLEENQ